MTHSYYCTDAAALCTYLHNEVHRPHPRAGRRTGQTSPASHVHPGSDRASHGTARLPERRPGLSKGVGSELGGVQLGVRVSSSSSTARRTTLSIRMAGHRAKGLGKLVSAAKPAERHTLRDCRPAGRFPHKSLLVRPVNVIPAGCGCKQGALNRCSDAERLRFALAENHSCCIPTINPPNTTREARKTLISAGGFGTSKPQFGKVRADFAHKKPRRAKR
jgi:hypothetical protein